MLHCHKKFRGMPKANCAVQSAFTRAVLFFEYFFFATSFQGCNGASTSQVRMSYFKNTCLSPSCLAQPSNYHSECEEQFCRPFFQDVLNNMLHLSLIHISSPHSSNSLITFTVYLGFALVINCLLYTSSSSVSLSG